MEYDVYRTGLSWDYCSMILFSNTSYLHHLRGLTFRPVKLATKVFTILFLSIRWKFIDGAQLLVHSPILTILNNTQYKLNTILNSLTILVNYNDTFLQASVQSSPRMVPLLPLPVFSAACQLICGSASQSSGRLEGEMYFK